MSKSLDRRRDNRSVDQFKADIKAATEREQMLMQIFAKEMLYRGIDFKYENFGVDNSGELVENSNNRPDFKVVMNGIEYLYEIKCNKFSHKQTFKIYDIKEYIRYNAHILLIYGIGHEEKIDYSTTRWAIISPQSMTQMLLDKPILTGDPKWGNKPMIVIYPKEYPNYFKEDRLTFNDSK